MRLSDQRFAAVKMIEAGELTSISSFNPRASPNFWKVRMTTNRLAKSEVRNRGSVFTASEYAARAEANGDPVKAKLWREAARDGWDAENYDPVAAEDHREKIAIARRAWAGRQ